MDTPSAAPARREGMRLRLPPAVRNRQILDAALAVFAEHGYAAARMDDIALRSGLSKGGLYAHFASKEQVFEALLSRLLAPPSLARPAGPLSLEQWVDWLLDEIYARFSEPGLRAGLRLLVAEGERVPTLVTQWHRQVVQPYEEAVAAQLAVQQPADGGAEPPLLAREPWLALSPAVHGLIMQTVLPPALVPGRERLRRGHRELLLRLLQPRPPASAA